MTLRWAICEVFEQFLDGGAQECSNLRRNLRRNLGRLVEASEGGHTRGHWGTIMVEVLTAAQMRALEGAAIEQGLLTGVALMERAGAGVVAAIHAHFAVPDRERGASPSRSPRYLETKEGARAAFVLCGPGNNGGDGYVIARLLQAAGWRVEVQSFGDVAALPPDARVNYDRWCALGAVTPYVDAEFSLNPEDFGRDSVIVDAGFGIGLSRPVVGLDAFARCCRSAVRAKAGWRREEAVAQSLVVAVDVPSGLDADSGYAVMGPGEGQVREQLHADLTVTFHAPKLGQYLGHGPEICGALEVVDIGLAGARHEGAVQRVEAKARRLRKSGGHKFAHGHVFVLGGGPGKGGAARLSARGALRVGAGLVTLGVERAALAENAARLDAVMLSAVKDGGAFEQILGDGRIGVVVLGPGLGHDRARDLVPVALEAGRRCVLDADALSAYEVAPNHLFDRLNGGTVLTPHMGEFRRLFPDIASKLTDRPTQAPAFSKVDAVRAAAARAQAVVLLKGADTVIAHPDGHAALHAACYAREMPWLATAGAGDVLAGIIAGLMARGFSAFDAAQQGAWLHVEAARAVGPGMIAEDLPEALREVFRTLETPA
ncbi:MAG: NAD(P)H-hydrate dehydratase [Maritimibacter sp.]